MSVPGVKKTKNGFTKQIQIGILEKPAMFGLGEFLQKPHQIKRISTCTCYSSKGELFSVSWKEFN